jgi:hypothetical protein
MQWQGVRMEKACGATHLKIFGDLQLVAQQMMNKCDAVNDNMIAYRMHTMSSKELSMDVK